ncbi:MAG: ABC transporter substrate-binding protein [Lachnospiraceae bacterium]|nr:ABC transporter substrate-binding protein [Lachnospiraceae bacterium]
MKERKIRIRTAAVLPRRVTVLLVILMLLSGCFSGTPRLEEPTETVPSLVFAFPAAYGQENESFKEVQEEMNAILLPRLGVTVQFLNFPLQHYTREMEKVLAGTSQVDIMLCGRSYIENWLLNNLCPLDELLQEEGSGIFSCLSEEAMEGCRLQGQIYGLPNVRDYAITTDTYCLNEALLEKYGYKAEDFHSMEDLEELFATVHREDPEVIILSSNLESVLSNRRYLKPQSSFVSMLDEQTDTYVNYFETEEYRSLLERSRTWYEKGYVGFEYEEGIIRMKEGTVLAESRCGKPGAAEEVSAQRKEPYCQVCLGEDIINQDVYVAFVYTITKNTISPEKSMEVLEALYTSPELNRLLVQVLAPWFIPNLFLTEPDDGYPEDIWEQTKAYNEGAKKASDVSFVFDPSLVMQEYLAVLEVYYEYKPLLENGMVPPEEGIPRLLAALDDAGMERVLEEQNRQYQRWKMENQR